VYNRFSKLCANSYKPTLSPGSETNKPVVGLKWLHAKLCT